MTHATSAADSHPAMPSELALDAWSPRAIDTHPAGALIGPLHRPERWAMRRGVVPPLKNLAPPAPADLRDWRHSTVGWGVVLAEGAPIPPALTRLIANRGDAPIFRYRPGDLYHLSVLREERSGTDRSISGAPYGIGERAIPYYLLLYGTPDVLPWRLQYVLSASRAVGRLTLTGDALERYAEALLGEWSDASVGGARPDRAVIWSVDHHAGQQDITTLMRDALGAPLHAALAADTEIGLKGVCFVDGSRSATGATTEALLVALDRMRPGLVVTTSHGMTGPVDDAVAMRAQLGVPVAQDGVPVRPDEVSAAWQPGGAIWYAHACCSAGSDATSGFGDLFPTGHPVDVLLSGVTRLGSCVAPLAEHLLGAERPLRAFVGHVEPTFDWTLRHVGTGDMLTDGLRQALYDRLYRGAPIGHALAAWYARISKLYAEYENARISIGRGDHTLPMLLAGQLGARDVQSTVILGDPTVALRAPI